MAVTQASFRITERTAHSPDLTGYGMNAWVTAILLNYNCVPMSKLIPNSSDISQINHYNVVSITV
jgi:hypothetical protein